jgi:hypothetical protein
MIEPMIRRLAALVLVALLLASNFAAVDCAGWQPSARERMACCIKADHACPDQLAADQCCAAGELSQQLTVTSSIATVPASAASVVTLRWFFNEASLVPISLSLSRFDHPQSPPHFRRTALLI